ncbi:MAG: hypothetical protein ACRCX2_34800 [Paraclostridium sp.]
MLIYMKHIAPGFNAAGCFYTTAVINNDVATKYNLRTCDVVHLDSFAKCDQRIIIDSVIYDQLVEFDILDRKYQALRQVTGVVSA